jgi:hypothetical protein
MGPLVLGASFNCGGLALFSSGRRFFLGLLGKTVLALAKQIMRATTSSSRATVRARRRAAKREADVEAKAARKGPGVPRVRGQQYDYDEGEEDGGCAIPALAWLTGLD